MPKNQKRGKSPKIKRGFFPVGLIFRLFPVAIPLLFFGILSFLLFRGTSYFLTHSPYFSIKRVEASSTHPDFSFKSPELMKSLLDENIFVLSLKTYEKRLSRTHPELLKVNVNRVFPSQVRLEVTPRIPVARLYGEESFLVDREGTILPPSHTLNREFLPTVSGLGERITKEDIGKAVKTGAFHQALDFLEELRGFPELQRFIQTLDVGDEENLSFGTPQGVEVRVGRGDFREKLALFDRTRVMLGKRMQEVKYIDLRFDEPVIGAR